MGEQARQPDAPKFADTPMEVLTSEIGKGYTLVDKYGIATLGAFVGAMAVAGSNRVRSRPLWSGIQRHIITSVVCSFLGLQWSKSRMAARAENDEVLKHYISLHPEDFPPFERQRFKDAFLPWIPVR